MNDLDYALGRLYSNDEYEIHLTDEGINEDLAPALVQAARDLMVYISDRTPVRPPPEQAMRMIPVVRCFLCDTVITGETATAPSLAGRVGHLTACHGWRMDGHRYDDHNVRLDV